MHTYVHAYIHSFIHTYMHSHLYTYIYSFIHIFMHTYIHIVRNRAFFWKRCNGRISYQNRWICGAAFKMFEHYAGTSDFKQKSHSRTPRGLEPVSHHRFRRNTPCMPRTAALKFILSYGQANRTCSICNLRGSSASTASRIWYSTIALKNHKEVPGWGNEVGKQVLSSMNPMQNYSEI